MPNYSASTTDTLSKRPPNPMGNMSSFMSSFDCADKPYNEECKLDFVWFLNVNI